MQVDESIAKPQEQECEIWPENWDSVRAFCAMGTQWRIASGMAGSMMTGLDYGVVPATMRLMGFARERWPALFADLRVMEAAALKTMNARRNRGH